MLGATGASGKLAIQIAKHLGAGRVVAAGRNEAVLKTLPALGADAVISLNQPDAALKQAFIQEAAHQRFDIVLNDLCGLAWTTKQIKLSSDGSPWRPLVHVEDMCQAIHLSLIAPADRVRGQVYNVGSTEQNYRVIEIAKIVANEFPGCELIVGAAGADNRSYRVNFDKIQRVLPDFKCKWTAETGAKQMHEMFKKIDMSEEEFRSPPFTRLKMLNKLRKSGVLNDQLFWTYG